MHRQLLTAVQDLFRKYSRIVYTPALLVAALVTYFAFLACNHVWLHYRVMQLGYKLGTAQTEQEALHQDKKRLTIEAGSATTPGVLMQLAADPFAMEHPASSQLRRITGPEETLPMPEHPPAHAPDPHPAGHQGGTKEHRGHD